MKSEINIQRELWKLIQAYRVPGVIIYHVPNGEKRDIRTAVRLKEMGVTPGVLDLPYIVNGRPGFLELKKEDGRPSKDQLDFMVACANQRVDCDVAYSVIQACLMLQSRGVLDPSIKFKLSDDPGDRAGAGRTVRRRAVRPTSEAGRVPL